MVFADEIKKQVECRWWRWKDGGGKKSRCAYHSHSTLLFIFCNHCAGWFIFLNLRCCYQHFEGRIHESLHPVDVTNIQESFLASVEPSHNFYGRTFTLSRHSTHESFRYKSICLCVTIVCSFCFPCETEAIIVKFYGINDAVTEIIWKRISTQLIK